MTISTQTSQITYQGNGSTLIFTFPFVADQASDLQVVTTNLTTGVSTTLNPSVYTVVINVPPTGGLWGIGGSVTYPNTGSPPVPISVGTTITIQRAVPYTQNTSINNQGAFYPQAIEQGLDILQLQIQQLDTALQYSLQFPETDLQPPQVLPAAINRVNGYLTFDSQGQPQVTQTAPVTLSVAFPRSVTNTTTHTIPILLSDAFGGVSVYQSGSSVVTLQLPTAGGPYPIFDGSLNSSSFPILVLPPSGKTILGQSSYRIANNGESVTFYNDGIQILIG